MTQKISIIGGTGKMGTLFAKALTDKGYEVIISGRQTLITPIEAAKKGDIVIVCVPISITEEVIKQIAPYVREDSILSDFTSIKTFPCRAMLENSKSNIIGGHPVFGPTVDIKNQPFVICPLRASEDSLNTYKDILKSLGLNVIQMTPEEHDKEMAVIQCMNQFANLSFANSLKMINFDIKKGDLFSPAFLLKLNVIERMLSQNPSLYAEIETYNPYAKEYAEKYLNAVLEIKEAIDSKDSSKLEEKIKAIQEHFNKLKDFIAPSIEPAKVIPTIITDSSHKISVLGPEYSYCHILAKIAYPESEFVLCSNIEDIFELVSKSEVSMGIAPIENMLNGTIRETLFSLRKYNVKINKLYNLAIHHSFASRSKEFNKIASHQQALAQCSFFLKGFKKGKEIIETPSTSRAMEIASLDKEYAAIGSKLAAEHYGLTILNENIEDNHNNTTSFVLISKKENVHNLSGKIRTSILISPEKDKPGLLYEILSIFKKNYINLTKIESIPTRNKIGEYIFYIEFDGDLKEERVAQAVDIVKSMHDFYSLGSYELENINDES